LCSIGSGGLLLVAHVLELLGVLDREGVDVEDTSEIVDGVVNLVEYSTPGDEVNADEHQLLVHESSLALGSMEARCVHEEESPADKLSPAEGVERGQGNITH